MKKILVFSFCFYFHLLCFSQSVKNVEVRKDFAFSDSALCKEWRLISYKTDAPETEKLKINSLHFLLNKTVFMTITGKKWEGKWSINKESGIIIEIPKPEGITWFSFQLKSVDPNSLVIYQYEDPQYQKITTYYFKPIKK